MPVHMRQAIPIRASQEEAPRDVPRKLLLTVEEAANLLSVGRPKMWQLVMTGEVLSVKIGGSRRVPVAALEAFVGRLAAVAVGTNGQEGEQYGAAW